MQKYAPFLLLMIALFTLSGCGGNTAPTAVAEQDEIAKYAAENPESAKPNTEGINP